MFFNDAWLTEDGLKDWVCRDSKDQHVALCKVSHKLFSIKSMGKAALLSHAEGAKHKDLLALALKRAQPGIAVLVLRNPLYQAVLLLQLLYPS